MTSSPLTETEKLKRQVVMQQQQIDLLQKELTHIRVIALATQRDLQPIKNDRKRIVKILRPLLPIGRTVRGFIRRINPFASSSSFLAPDEIKYINNNKINQGKPDKFSLRKKKTSLKNNDKVELLGSRLQGLAIQNSNNALIASANSFDTGVLASCVRNFLSSHFEITGSSQKLLSSEIKFSALNDDLRDLTIEHSANVAGSIVDANTLVIKSKKGKCSLYFPTILAGKLPSIDIIIPVYNDSKRLGRAIRSIMNQHYDGRVNIIVVDDASTDNPKAVVKPFANVRYIRQTKNMGAYSARNTGLEAATSDLVTFHDSDDISLPYRLARTVHLLEQSKADLYIGTYLRVDDSGQIIVTNHRTRRKGLILLSGRPQLIRDRLGGFDRVRGGGDSEFIERAEMLGLGIIYDDVVSYLADHGQTGLTAIGPLKIWDAKGQYKRNETREAYVAAYRAWHKSSSIVDFPKPSEVHLRRFSAPSKILDGSWSETLPISGDNTVDQAMQRYCIVASPFDQTISWAESVKQARSSTKLITVVIVSNRGGDFVKNAFRQVRAFCYPQLQIIYVANATQAVISSDILDDDITQIETDASKNLGHCLNLAAEFANGDYFFKIDDDDYYGSDYVAEAMVALENGYDFVGKWSIFYHFDTIGDMILRPPERDLQQARHLSGATLAIKTDLVREIGFSETLESGTDTDFIEKAKARGVILFSTSPFNFAVGRNNNTGHTWQTSRNNLLHYGCSVNVSALSSVLEPGNPEQQ